MPRHLALPKDFAFDLMADPRPASGGLLEVTDCRGAWVLQGTATRHGQLVALAWRIDPDVHVLRYYTTLMRMQDIPVREQSMICLAWELERVPCSDRIPWRRHQVGDLEGAWMYPR